jgi:hypothetical protein
MLEFIQIPKREFVRSGVTGYNTWFGTSYIMLGEGTFCMLNSLVRMKEVKGIHVEKHGLVYIDVEVPTLYK